MKNFIKVKQDFVCENCGEKVVGDGYTDHCSLCLWGKHVDFEIPGDRVSDCGGLMRPVKTEFSIFNFQFSIKYKCTKCRHEFKVREGVGDNRKELMALSMI